MFIVKTVLGAILIMINTIPAESWQELFFMSAIAAMALVTIVPTTDEVR